jgi:hypothetical protein
MRTQFRSRSIACVIGIAVAVMGLTTSVAPASAVQSFNGAQVTATFVGEKSLTVDYGDPWVFTLKLVGSWEGEFALDPSSGTVDISATGISGTFMKSLPIQADGRVYVTQLDDQPLINPGTYALTATFKPAKTDGLPLSTAKSKNSATLVVNPISVEPHVAIDGDAGAGSATVTATFGGAYVDKRGGAPAGDFHFELKSASGATIDAIDAPVSDGATDPVVVTFVGDVEKGESYTLASTFTPARELATGVTVLEIPQASLTVSSDSPIQVLNSDVPFPLWAIIALIVLAAALGITGVVLATRIGPARPVAPRAVATGDEVEIMSLDEAGLISVDSMPIEKGPWLLSDIDPEVGVPTAALPTSEDVPTELLSTAQEDTVVQADAEPSDAVPGDAVPEATPEGDSTER